MVGLKCYLNLHVNKLRFLKQGRQGKLELFILIFEQELTSLAAREGNMKITETRSEQEEMGTAGPALGPRHMLHTK